MNSNKNRLYKHLHLYHLRQIERHLVDLSRVVLFDIPEYPDVFCRDELRHISNYAPIQLSTYIDRHTLPAESARSTDTMDIILTIAR